MIINEETEVQVNGQKVNDVNKIQELAEKLETKAQKLEKEAQNNNLKHGLFDYIAGLFNHVAEKMRGKKEQPKENIAPTQVPEEKKEEKTKEDKPEEKKEPKEDVKTTEEPKEKTDDKDAKIQELEKENKELQAKIEELNNKVAEQPTPQKIEEVKPVNTTPNIVLDKPKVVSEQETKKDKSVEASTPVVVQVPTVGHEAILGPIIVQESAIVKQNTEEPKISEPVTNETPSTPQPSPKEVKPVNTTTVVENVETKEPEFSQGQEIHEDICENEEQPVETQPVPTEHTETPTEQHIEVPKIDEAQTKEEPQKNTEQPIQQTVPKAVEGAKEEIADVAANEGKDIVQAVKDKGNELLDKAKDKVVNSVDGKEGILQTVTDKGVGILEQQGSELVDKVNETAKDSKNVINAVEGASQLLK